MKIIQFQAMPNDAHWQGATICLCDDGNLYLHCHHEGRLQLIEYINAKEDKTKQSELIDLINHASYSVFENGADAPEGKRRVVDLEDVIAIIEEEL